MFSPETLKKLQEDDAPAFKQLPVSQQLIDSREPPFVEPAKKGRKIGLVGLAVLVLGVVGGSIAGTQYDWERPAIKMPETAKSEPVSVAKADAPKMVVKQSNCNCPDGCKCDGPTCTCDVPKPPIKTPEPVKVAKEEPKRIEVKPEPKPAHDFKLANLPKPKPAIREQPIKEENDRPAKVAIEETSNKNAEKRVQTFDRILDAQQAGKEQDKPVLKWAGGILDNKLCLATKEQIGDKAIHFVDPDGGKIGPHVMLLSNDDNTWYLRESKFTATTGERISSILPTRNYQNVKFPQAEPPMTVRNRNTPEGLCLTCAVDTLVKHNGYQLDLMGDPRNPLRNDFNKNPWAAWRVLNSRKIPSQWTRPGFRDIGYVRKACEEGIGCTVGINMNHEINVVGVSDKQVAIIDNNDPHLKTRLVSRQAFGRVWDGTTVVVFPEGKEHVLRSWGQCGPDGCVPQGRELDGNAQFMPGGDTGQFSPTGRYRQQLNGGPFNAYPIDFSCTMSRMQIIPNPPTPPDSMADVMTYKATPVPVDAMVEFWTEAGYSADEAKAKAAKSKSGVWE